MGEKVKQFLKFGVEKIGKKKFHSSENPTAIGDKDINIIMTSDA